MHLGFVALLGAGAVALGTPGLAQSMGRVVVPPLTPVEIEIGEEVGSAVSKTGDTFPIRLKTPLVSGTQTLIPAGVIGQGEVVHAKKSGGSGAAGELVLAARYLEVNGRRLRLRSLNLSATGKDKMGLATAAGATVLGPFALLLKGKNTVVPAGHVATAKTAEAFTVDAALESSSTAPASSSEGKHQHAHP